ncbi:MAG: OPT/YSL family transporter [Planctomycetota bacterium]
MTEKQPPSSLVPRLAPIEWILFTVLAAVIAAANIYTTLLIGWGDTGSIVAVLASVAVLSLIGRKVGVYQLNLGQTMVSAGGGVGFAVASYAAIHIVKKDWDPNPYALMLLFATTGILGALVGNVVRRQMVQYFFPSGTACAVIQRAVTEERAPGERSRPVWLLTVWSLVAGVLTIPTKISLSETKEAILSALTLKVDLGRLKEIPIGVDPLYYGIGMVVGPRIGLGMIIGALLPTLAIAPMLENATKQELDWGPTGDWIKWTAIAVLTLPTFATIVFAYLYKTKVPVPPGFAAGATTYTPPSSERTLHAVLLVVGLALGAVAGQIVFGLPWYATAITAAIAVPLSIVNGRVTGDTDINPVRLVAIVLLSGFFWLVSREATVLLGMAVVGATIASVAVDMMQDFRTGHLLDQNPSHQTFVQFCGVVVGAIASIPVLNTLIGDLGIGEGSGLKAPGAQVWAAMANAMAGEVKFTDELIWAVVIVSVVGTVYAWFTVWPRSAKWMPSIFGIGIGLLVGLDAAMAIFLGGMIKHFVTLAYTASMTQAAADAGESKEERASSADYARRIAGDDTMVVGASVFAASAVLSIALVMADKVFEAIDWYPWWLAG